MFKDDYFEHLPQEGEGKQILPQNFILNDEYEGMDDDETL